METRLSILFYGKKTSRKERDKILSIYLRVTINGERFEVSTQRYIEPAKWSIDAGKARGNSEDARSINMHLYTLKQKVYDYQQTILSEGQVFTKESLRLKWYGLDERIHKLIEVFRQHNDQLKVLVDREVAKETLGKFNTTVDHTVNFLQWKYRTSDIDIIKLDYTFLTDFEFYLKSVKKCNHNTTMKYLSNVRKIVNICIKNGWLTKDPFFGYKMSKKEVIREFLSEAELQDLMNRDFNNNRLNQVRDIFVFSCFTGLASVDAKRLKRSEIAVGIDSEKWIFTKRKKTDTPARIPLLATAL